MKFNNETKVGLMVTASFTIFIILVAMLAKINVSRSGYIVKVYYGFLNDLRVGSPVKIAGGIRIGQVEQIKQSGEKSEVTVWIDNQYKLIKTSKFAIFTSGLIGEKYINVFVPPTTNVDDFIKDGDKIYGIDPASFDQMMLTFQSFMQDESGGQVLAEIFQNSKNFVENLNKIADENRYDIRKGIIGAKATIILLSQQTKVLMDQLNKLSRDAVDITAKNKEDINIAIKNLSEFSTNLNKIGARIESGRGTIGKLLVEEEIYNNLNDATIYAKDLFKQLKKNPSKLFFQTKE